MAFPFKQVVNIVRENRAILGWALSLPLLLPSLPVVLVNLAGFTTTGVVGGSVAAFIQSTFYAGATGGIFSMLQSFAATAVIAPYAVLGWGGALLTAVARAIGYW